jgi:hypothetical protein
VLGACWPLVMDSGSKAKKKEEERRSTNYAEGTFIEDGSKWSKMQKRRSEVRENDSLNEKIEEDRQARKLDHGQLNKQKKPPTDALEHLVGKQER